MKNYGNPGQQVQNKFIYQLGHRLESVFDWIFYTNPPVQIINDLDNESWNLINQQQGLESINNSNVLEQFQWTIEGTDPTQSNSWVPNLILKVYPYTEDLLHEKSYKDPQYLYNPWFLMYHQGFTLPADGYVGFFKPDDMFARGLIGTSDTTHQFIIKNEDWIKLVTYLQLQNTYYAWGFTNYLSNVGDTSIDFWAKTIADDTTILVKHHIEETGFENILVASNQTPTDRLFTPENLSFGNTIGDPNNTFISNLAFKHLPAGASIISIDQPTSLITPMDKDDEWSKYLIYTISAASYFIPKIQDNKFYFQYLDKAQSQYSDNYLFSFDTFARRYVVPDENTMEWVSTRYQWAIPSFYLLYTGEFYPNIYAVNALGSTVATWTNNQPLCSEFISITTDNNVKHIDPVFMDSYHSINIENIDNHTYYLYTIIKAENLDSEVDNLHIQSRIY